MAWFKTVLIEGQTLPTQKVPSSRGKRRCCNRQEWGAAPASADAPRLNQEIGNYTDRTKRQAFHQGNSTSTAAGAGRIAKIAMLSASASAIVYFMMPDFLCIRLELFQFLRILVPLVRLRLENRACFSISRSE
jgi:hypothetical protein